MYVSVRSVPGMYVDVRDVGKCQQCTWMYVGVRDVGVRSVPGCMWV